MNALHGLYAITPTGLSTERLLSLVELALKGGINLLQYRTKQMADEQRQREAAALLALCREAGCPLIINDDPMLAKKIKAQGVHLGQGDGDPQQVRSLLGKNALIGVTCHGSLLLAEQASQAGADYLAFGAFFPSKTKPQAQQVPLALLAEAKKRFALPVVAIGGITPANAAPLVEAGADLLAVVDALFTSDNIPAQCRAFQQVFTNLITPTSLDSQ